MFRTVLLAMLIAAGLRAEQTVLLVLLRGAGAVGIYTTDGKLLDKVPVGEFPREMVLAKDGRHVYVSDYGVAGDDGDGKGGNTVSIVDIESRKRIDRVLLRGYQRPYGLAVDPPTGRIAVTTEEPSHVMIIDPDSHRVIRNFATEAKASRYVSFGPVKTGAVWAFVSNTTEGNVSAVHLETGVVVKIPTGAGPEGSVLSAGGNDLFVCNRDGSSITIVDPERRAVKGEFKTVGQGPVRCAITPDGRFLLYALLYDHKIEFADLETRRPVAQVSLDGAPASVSISPDGQFAYASGQAQDTVYVISVAERKLVRQFQTGKGSGPGPVIVANVP